MFGGTAAVPLGGSSTTLYSVSKYAKFDCTIQISCGERGNELAETVLGFPEVFL